MRTRKNTVRTDIIIIAVIVLLIVGGILLALFTNNESGIKTENNADINGDGQLTYSDYIGKRVGILTGSSFEKPTFEFLPDSDYYYFDSFSDMLLALKQEKIDCFIEDEPQLRIARIEQPYMDYLPEVLREDKYSFCFQKNGEKAELLQKQFNEMLADLNADGTLEKLRKKWYEGDYKSATIDSSGFTGKNGTLNIFVNPLNVPTAMIIDGELKGYAIELMALFCQRYGYDYKYEQANIVSGLAGIASGIYDIGANSVTITPEREESVRFSDPIYVGGISLAVRASDTAGMKDQDKGTSVSAFNGKRAGVVTGSMHDEIVSKNFSDTQTYNYNNYSDLISALKSDKIDFFLAGAESAEEFVSDNPDLTYLKAPVESLPIGAMFAKTEAGAALRDKFNEFLAKIYADGTRDEIYRFWQSEEAEDSYVDYSDLKPTNGTLVLATSGSESPISYICNGKIAGTDPDIAVRFCREYGYGIDVQVLDSGGLIPGLAQGMYDFVLNDIVITEERKESVYFSDPYNYGNVHLIARKSDISAASGGRDASSDIDTINMLADKHIGVMSGSVYEDILKKGMPDADLSLFKKAADMAAAVSSGEIDAFVCSDIQAEALSKEVSGLRILSGYPDRSEIAFAFPKTEKGALLRDEFNEFLAKIMADGTYDDLVDRWTSGSEKNVEYYVSDGKKGVLKMATTGTTEPYTFMYNGKLVGLDIDLASRFCREYGYDLDINVMDFGSIIPKLSSQEYDFAGANITVTETRAQSVYFSDSYTYNDIAFVVNNDVYDAGKTDSSEQSWFESIVSSFEKNFIREDRWKMILEGIGTTCLITGLSAVFGSILAFLLCLFRRTGSILANVISNIYVKLLQGTPIVVLLMILYYVIFGKSGLEAVWVAVIGFTLNFGAYASEIMQSGIESIDGGQREAALALGYTENQTFFRFIFPQAAVRFIPVYKQEIVSLLKSTSIVGYIAVQDLTKMSDIIRSRTYEAFFPLIATAVIYFILAWLIALILKLVLKCFDKRHRNGGSAK